jgi:MFS family permease
VQDAVSRRLTLLGACLLYIAAVAVTFTANGFPGFVAGRFWSGFMIGAMTTASPVYLAEVAPLR